MAGFLLAPVWSDFKSLRWSKGRSHVAVMCALGGAEVVEWRRKRRFLAIIESESEISPLQKAVDGIDDVVLETFTEDDVLHDAEVMERSLEVSDAFLFFPKGGYSSASDAVLNGLRKNYPHLAVSLFMPTTSIECLALNKLGEFDAMRIISEKRIFPDLGAYDHEDAEKLIQQLPELLSFVCPMAVSYVQRFSDLIYSWKQSSFDGYRVSLQIAANHCPPASVISRHDVLIETDRLIRELKRLPTRQDFITKRKGHIHEAIENAFGGLNEVASAVSLENLERRERTRSRLRLIEKKELEHALSEFCDQHLQSPMTMPREHELELAGRTDLSSIIRSRGGFEKVAGEMGMKFPTQVVDNVYPTLLSLKTSIQEFIDVRALELDSDQFEIGRLFMPRYDDFRLYGRDDLVNGIRSYGGIRKLAKVMNLRLHRTATYSYKEDMVGLGEAISAFQSDHKLSSDILPTYAQLREKGRLDLIAGIKHNGGMNSVASSMGLKQQRGAKILASRLKDVEWLKSELSRFGHDMPTIQELLDHGRVDLVKSVRLHGGRETVAQLCGLAVDRDLTFLSEDFSDLEVCESDEALSFSAGSSEPEVPADIQNHDDDQARRTQYRPPHYFRDFSRVRSEVSAFNFYHGDQGVMPTAQELISRGRGDLLRGIKRHGGQKMVARKLGLVVHSQGRNSALQRHRGQSR
eukprot:CAMPEP_0184744946 /NCGR_PEP_ID=MMETSP0315-20130426/7697_1 /TAXON_ID=101924 /ORGANISM="Rhodosorus marinus, Strain UTEX LB 2760" /LENGTH=690 /DNA_ID=CAMNT_0027216935 /DNA_START=223 /DNA_END=2295 /DNA_ORIENTATION=-